MLPENFKSRKFDKNEIVFNAILAAFGVFFVVNGIFWNARSKPGFENVLSILEVGLGAWVLAHVIFYFADYRKHRRENSR